MLLGLTLFRQPDIAAANFADFWGTGDWSIAVIPVLGAAMVGSLFSSDAWNNVTFAAAEVQNPTRNLPRALAIGTGMVSLLYILANVAYLNILPFSGDPNGADVLARGLQYAAQDRVGTAAIEVVLGAGGATVMAVAILLSTFGCNNGLILVRPAGLLRDGARRSLLPAGGHAAPDVPHAGLRAGGAGGLGQRALHQRHLRAAARLRDLRGASCSTS